MMLNFARKFFIIVVFVETILAKPKSGIGEAQKKSGFIEGDFIVGALFPVHERPLLNGNIDPLACGKIREKYGIQRVEAAFFAIDSINSNTSFLPEIKLGINIKDECWSDSVSLHQSIKLIEEPDLSSDYNMACSLDEDDTSSPIIGVIGPGSSSNSVQVQNLLKLFEITQVGYSATTAELSDKTRYPYFLRVVPSDEYQVELMMVLLSHYNWTYFSVLYTNNNYGQNGLRQIRELAPEFGVCISQVLALPSDDDTDYFYIDAVEKLSADQNVNAVICFCDGLNVKGLLKAVKILNMTGRFMFIGSESWASRMAVVTDVEEQAQGSITIRVAETNIPEFDAYYFARNVTNNKRNPWFTEFWEYRFECTMKKNNDSNLPLCTGNEDLSVNHEQDSKISYVIKSVYVLAHALHDFQKHVCGNKTGPCDELFPFNLTLFREFIFDVNFTYKNEIESFADWGEPPPRYDIMNFQKLANGSYAYVQVGSFNDENYIFDEEDFVINQEVQFPFGKNGSVISVCSAPCGPGQVKVKTQEKQCCWICVECKAREILINETTCLPCPLEYWPNSDNTTCYKLPVLVYIEWSDPQALVSIACSIIGIILTLITTVIFVKYRATPVVRSSTPELCYMMLFGMILAHLIIYIIIARPTLGNCIVLRVLPPLCFTIIYASLLVKTNRIARMLAISKKRFPNMRPRFMSLKSQIYITASLIAVQIIISVIMLFEASPAPVKEYVEKGTTASVYLICPVSNQCITVPFAFVSILVIMCTMYAVKTRNLPHNFNEAKFIGFSMYVTCITWIAFGLIFFGSKFKVITTCVCSSTNALVILIFLFFPKLYIILFKPELNTRSHFTTTKGIRCFIGNTSYTAGGQNKNLADDFPRQPSKASVTGKHEYSDIPHNNGDKK